jgi:NAD(P)H-dependent FMN reductase
MSRPNILVLAGSTRTHSVHRKLARELVSTLQSAGAEAIFADLRDFTLPLYDGDLEEAQGRPATALALKELAREADGFVIASPEYNGSYPAVLKNAIDWMSRPDPGERHLAVFRGKPAAIVSATPGPHGGARGLKQLRELLGMIGVDVAAQVGIPQSGAALDEDGRLTRPDDIAALDALASAVVQAANTKSSEIAAA